MEMLDRLYCLENGKQKVFDTVVLFLRCVCACALAKHVQELREARRLELQVVASLWVLGTELWSFGRATMSLLSRPIETVFKNYPNHSQLDLWIAESREMRVI